MKSYFITQLLIVGVVWYVGLEEKYKIKDFNNFWGLYAFIVVPFVAFYGNITYYPAYGIYSKSHLLPLIFGLTFSCISIGCLFGFADSIDNMVLPFVAYINSNKPLQWVMLVLGIALLSYQFISDYYKFLGCFPC